MPVGLYAGAQGRDVEQEVRFQDEHFREQDERKVRGVFRLVAERFHGEQVELCAFEQLLVEFGENGVGRVGVCHLQQSSAVVSGFFSVDEAVVPFVCGESHPLGFPSAKSLRFVSHCFPCCFLPLCISLPVPRR